MKSLINAGITYDKYGVILRVIWLLSSNECLIGLERNIINKTNKIIELKELSTESIRYLDVSDSIKSEYCDSLNHIIDSRINDWFSSYK
ncbi:hypothetical protein POW04_00040 [Enterobacter cloacae]|uniref:hypothetical protein n=1 Tax=Enterobacter cloacae TaxID=550 RepID=UPI002FFB79CD